MQATDFGHRARAAVDLLLQELPDLIALQGALLQLRTTATFHQCELDLGRHEFSDITAQFGHFFDQR